MRRDAVLGFRTPLVTALLSADVATCNEVLASSIFLSATAVCTFFTRLLTALSAARLRVWRFSAWRARRIVDLWMTGIANSCTKERICNIGFCASSRQTLGAGGNSA